MRVLAVIANYGTGNDQYLKRLLDEYRSLPYQTHVVVLTNVPKDLGQDVEVVVETPRGDPWSFPFAHKRVLADHADEYDLFIYSEDDTLITQRNIDAFMRVTEALPENEIAGFMRSERTQDGAANISTAHGHFHWDPRSVTVHGAYTFAYFSNEHSASYLLTRLQLKRAVQSGGFLVGPHQEKYDLLVTAATDPYTQCGFKKMICISDFDDFVLPHLPNKYVGKLGLEKSEFLKQIDALKAIQKGARPCTSLLHSETRVHRYKWSKNYYEPASPGILALLPKGVRRVLSYGCGWGAMEAELVKRGIRVTAVPLDSVIGACAEARGIDVIYGDSESVMKELSGERFDCVLLSDILHLVPEPDRLLRSLTRLLVSNGVVIASAPNLSLFSIVWHRASRHPAFKNLGGYERSGIHRISCRTVNRWFAGSNLKVKKLVPMIADRANWVYRASGRHFGGSLASAFLVFAEKTG